MTNTSIDVDWTIPGLDILLQNPTKKLSRLVWKTMIRTNDICLHARFRPNKQYSVREDWSTLVLTLRSRSWIPQTDRTKSPGDSEEGVANLRFVRPADACQDLMPSGFTFDGYWTWLSAVGFGERKRAEERRKDEEGAREQERSTEEARRRVHVMDELGIPDGDESVLEDARAFVRLPKHKRREILWKDDDLPDSELENATRRSRHVQAQAKAAPKPTCKTLSRREDVNREGVRDGQTQPYLRAQYTSTDRRMICQVCKGGLPFRLSNGEYYFEMVEFLKGLERHYFQNYLALCPNHAAMYKHANGSAVQMMETFRRLEGQSLSVRLGGKANSIYFTKKHRFDVRNVLAVEDERSG